MTMRDVSVSVDPGLVTPRFAVSNSLSVAAAPRFCQRVGQTLARATGPFRPSVLSGPMDRARHVSLSTGADVSPLPAILSYLNRSVKANGSRYRLRADERVRRRDVP